MGLIARVMVAVLVSPLASVTWRETVGLNTVGLLISLPSAGDEIERITQVAIAAGGPLDGVRRCTADDRAFERDRFTCKES